MDKEKMYYLDKFCCICMNNSFLKHLFEVDSDGVSHYNKLTSSIAEMNFKGMNDQRLICGECCVTLNTVYNFRQLCLRSKTNLISQLQTSDHSGDTIKDCLKDIKPELIAVKNEGGSEKEDSNCLDGSNPQIEVKTESILENIDFFGSVKKECESEDEVSSVHEDATVDHVNEGARSDVKAEDVEHQTMMEDYSECYTEFKIEIKEDSLAEVKEEPMSDSEAPQDGSTSQAYTGTSEEPKGKEETTVGTELTQNTEKNNEGLYQCKICQKNFNSKKSLTNHSLTHTTERLFKCEICEKGLKNNWCLSIHMRTHSKERPYECEICKKGFKQKRYLALHMITHSSQKPYECKICKKDFNHKSNLTKHMQSHSSGMPYECEICQKVFKHKYYLSRHMKSHSGEKPYECEICRTGFKQKDYLTRHMKSHSGERPYICNICKKSFIYQCQLIGHMKSHSNEKPYKCEICKKCYNHQSSFIEHMKTHSSEKPHECKICKKSFFKKRNLKVHMKVHSSERPYECEICKRRFYQKTSCIRHMKGHSDENSQ